MRLVPQRPWPIWLLAVAIPCVLLLLNMDYWHRKLAAGDVAASTGSIAVPIYGSSIVCLVFTCLLTALATRRYSGKGTLLSWRDDRPWRTVIVTALFSVLALLCALSLGEAVYMLMHAEPIEVSMVLEIPLALLLLWWLGLLRVAAIERR